MIVQIEVNTRCNFSCWYCQNSQYEVPAARTMSLENFEIILHKLKRHYADRLPLISFAAYNEPTHDRHFKARLRLLTRLGFAYWWISNGSMMNKELVDFLLAERPNITNFYLNLCSSEPLQLAQLVNISQAAATRCLTDLSAALERLPALGRTIYINVHGEGDLTHLERVSAMRRWALPYKVRVVKAGLMDRAGMLRGVGKPINHQSASWLLCGTAHLSNLYIGVEGEVYLCCHDYYKESRFANLLEHDVDEVFAAAKRVAALRMLKQKFCKNCEFAIDLRKNPKAGLSFVARGCLNRLPPAVQRPLLASFRRARRWVGSGALK